MNTSLLLIGLATLLCCSVLVRSDPIDDTSRGESDKERQKGDEGVLNNDVTEEEDDVEADSDDPYGVFVAPRKAKTFLRVRRGWGIKSLWGEEQEEERESRENRAEATRRANHARFCRSNCWSGWSGWSSCSVACGTAGQRTRTRHHAPPSQCSSWVRSHGCPGSSVETQRNCNRVCQNGGTLRPRDCSCPPGYHGTCCQHRVRCGHPGRPSHGSVSPDGSSHYYGVVARFSCGTNYRIQGPASRTCRQNGQWSSSVPTCTLRTCVDPGTPPHSTRTGSTLTVGASVVYSCQTGYTMSGETTRVCQANGHWQPSAPTCSPVNCGELATPSGGTVSRTGTVYQSVATFSCHAGHYMEGSATRQCQANGQWDGSQPTCQRIMCEGLSTPTNGDMTGGGNDNLPLGSVLEFSCDVGYVLEGTSSRTCEGSGPEGHWSGTAVSCHPVDCGNPGSPEHGSKQGGLYTLHNIVTFQCIPGYSLSGAGQVQCQPDASWTHSTPTCQECPVNHFKSGLNGARQCEVCPDHSHTLSTASESLERCVCDDGYTGDHAPYCTEVLCPALSAPSHGQIESCDNHVGDVCEMSCVAGHIRQSGSERRQCGVAGTWSGQRLICQPCPVNTYKSDVGSCQSCPDESHTTGPGQELTGCVCDDGFTGPPGGQCQDVDECAGDVGCDQTCVNTYGDYHCACTQPGYVLDADDSTSCINRNQCPALEPPDNGGVVCVLVSTTNTERCEVKCNPGYEHLIRTNEFEECGPSTNWMWSNQVNDVPILPCVEQYFTGVTVEAEVAYFVDDCSSLTPSQKSLIAQQFVDALIERGVCQMSGESVCDIEDVTTECGPATDYEYDYDYDYDYPGRARRSVEQTPQELKLKFKMTVPEVAKSEVNCSNVCPENLMHTPKCQQRCVNQYENSSSQAIQHATDQLQQIFSHSVRIRTSTPQPPTESDQPARRRPSYGPTTRGPLTWAGPEVGRNTPRGSLIWEGHGPRPSIRPTRYLTWFARQAPTINIPGVVLRPKAGVRKSAIINVCTSGMVLHDNICVPCPPGSYAPGGNEDCMLCPRGTHQPDHQQSECLPCSTSTGRGSTSCPRPTDPSAGFGGLSFLLEQAERVSQRAVNHTVAIRVRVDNERSP